MKKYFANAYFRHKEKAIEPGQILEISEQLAERFGDQIIPIEDDEIEGLKVIRLEDGKKVKANFKDNLEEDQYKKISVIFDGEMHEVELNLKIIRQAAKDYIKKEELSEMELLIKDILADHEKWKEKKAVN
ncbi:MAG: hypothetical protein Q8934_14225 [Bacillota bacterium]|nr:hypothetical protein [Bacillota bacterium]